MEKGRRPVNIVLGGLGGQGILFMTKVFAEAGLRKGYRVLGAETHGMAQRGGSVVSHLRFGEVEGSLVEVGTAHFLLALEENEAFRNLPFLAPGGTLYVNSSDPAFPRKEVREYLEKTHIRPHPLDARRVAFALGAPMALNLALVGSFAAHEKEPFAAEDLRTTLAAISPERLRDVNLAVFDAGFQEGLKEQRPET